MLKKIYHIFIALLLLVTTTGIGISKHYCGDFWVSTSLFSEAETCCDDENCCHTENAFFQADEDFSAPQTSNTTHIQELTLWGFTAPFIANQTPAEQTAETFHQNNSPPPPTVNEALSFRQVFLL